MKFMKFFLGYLGEFGFWSHCFGRIFEDKATCGGGDWSVERDGRAKVRGYE